MSKKILKRSLALGALMAFVITGSAMAAEVYDKNYIEDYIKSSNRSYFKITENPGAYYSEPEETPYDSGNWKIEIKVIHTDEFKSYYDFKNAHTESKLKEQYYPGEEVLTGNKELDASVGFAGIKDESNQERNKYSNYLKTDLNGFKMTINGGLGCDGRYTGFIKGYSEEYSHDTSGGPTLVYTHIYTGLENLGLDLPGFDISDTKGGGELEINNDIWGSCGIAGYGKIGVDKLKIDAAYNAIQSIKASQTKEPHEMKIYANSIELNAGVNAIQVNNDLDILGRDKNSVDKLIINADLSPITTAHGATLNLYADEIKISQNTDGIIACQNSEINFNANKGTINSNVTAGYPEWEKTDEEKVNSISMTLGSGVEWTGAFTTNDGSTGNVTLNGATWKITSDSNISTLAGNDGKIVLGLRNEPAAAAYSLRSTGNNNAFYGLQIGDLTNSNLEVSGGAELTEAIENGTVDMTAEEALQQLADAVKTGENSQEETVSKVTIEAGETLGATSATIGEDGTIASITQDVNPQAAKVSKAATNLKAHYRAHMNDMNKRMGELRMANGEAGVWTRMVRGESEYEGAKMQYNQYQLGYDEKLSVDKRWTVGAAVTFAEGDGSYGQGSTDDKSTAFAIYGSKLNNDGTFVDLIARYAHLESDMEDSVYDNGDYSTNGYSVSAEFGKRIQQGNGLWIEPQVELTYGTIDSANFKLGTDYNAHFDSMDSFIARVGFSIGKDIKEGNVYARASYLYDFDGETTSLVTKNGIGTPTPEDFGGGWWEVGVGANINLSKATYIYADIEKTFGGEVDTNWQWNLGVRYSF